MAAHTLRNRLAAITVFIKATLIKWRNPHATCLRADRGALAQMDWPSFKAVHQRDARRQVSPNRLISIKTGGVQRVRQPHRAAGQRNQPSLRHAARPANLLSVMTVVPLDQRCLNDARVAHDVQTIHLPGYIQAGGSSAEAARRSVYTRRATGCEPLHTNGAAVAARHGIK